MLSEADENDIWTRLREAEEGRGRMDERLKAIEKTNGETKDVLKGIQKTINKSYVRISIAFGLLTILVSGAVGALIKYLKSALFSHF